MEDSSPSILPRVAAAALLVGGLGLWNGCDTAPTPDRDQQVPSVSALQIVPDSIHQSELAPGRIRDSMAQVSLGVLARATDTDGTVERVVFLLEPSSNPQGTLSGRLPALENAAENDVYGAVFDSLSVPLIDEIYTVRVFAVDGDSLASNQVTGQFRFVPADSSDAETTSERLLGPKLHAPSMGDVPALN